MLSRTSPGLHRLSFDLQALSFFTGKFAESQKTRLRQGTAGEEGGDYFMNIKKAIIGTSVVMSLLLSATSAFAHVVVKPNKVGAAAFQTFTIGVPNEKDIPTVAVRLVIPEGLEHVSPNVKPGWKIDIKKEPIGMKGEVLNTGEKAPERVTEITWTGGSIPAGQRDDFFFSAQAPAKETSLQWKAYQTYENGEVVAWDQKPSSNHDEAVKPYSETKVVNDLNTATDTHQETINKPEDSSENLSTILSIVAIILAGGSLYLQTRKKK